MFRAEVEGTIKRLRPRDFPIPEPAVRRIVSDTVAQEASVSLVSSLACALQKTIVVKKSLKQQIILHSQGVP